MGKAIATITYKAILDESYMDYKNFVGYSQADMLEELKQKGILSVYVAEYQVDKVELGGKNGK